MGDRTRRPTWGDVFNCFLDRGMQHSDAAVRADEWERRQAGRALAERLAKEG